MSLTNSDNFEIIVSSYTMKRRYSGFDWIYCVSGQRNSDRDINDRLVWNLEFLSYVPVTEQTDDKEKEEETEEEEEAEEDNNNCREDEVEKEGRVLNESKYEKSDEVVAAAGAGSPVLREQRVVSGSATTGAQTPTMSNVFPQQYCLRWKYHHSNLQTMFSQLLERQAYCDVTLACEGQTLRAHKVSLKPFLSIFSLFLLHREQNSQIIEQNCSFVYIIILLYSSNCVF